MPARPACAPGRLHQEQNGVQGGQLSQAVWSAAKKMRGNAGEADLRAGPAASGAEWNSRRTITQAVWSAATKMSGNAGQADLRAGPAASGAEWRSRRTITQAVWSEATKSKDNACW